MSIRIWQQSLTDLTLLPGYSQMLRDHANRICGPDTVVELHGLQPGTYPDAMPPIEMARYRWAHHLAYIQVVENAMRAEREDYDAVAISCFADPGLEEARSVVDIPVVSSLETALLVSSAIGRSFGLLTIDRPMVARVRELVHRYGFGCRITGVEPMIPPIAEFELDEAFAGSPAFVERFARQAQSMIAQGADVIIPAEGVLNTVLARNECEAVNGTPVLDSYASLLAFAEMLVRLRRDSGLRIARGGAYARPPETLIRHLRRITASALEEAEAHDATAPAAGHSANE
jgi:allantoin racemase